MGNPIGLGLSYLEKFSRDSEGFTVYGPWASARRWRARPSLFGEDTSTIIGENTFTSSVGTPSLSSVRIPSLSSVRVPSQSKRPAGFINSPYSSKRTIIQDRFPLRLPATIPPQRPRQRLTSSRPRQLKPYSSTYADWRDFSGRGP